MAPVSFRAVAAADLPLLHSWLVRPHVVEHRVVARTCGACGTTTEGPTGGVPAGRVQYGPGVGARAAWLTSAHFLPVRRARSVLNALCGLAVSDGWVAGVRGRAARPPG